MHGSILVCLYVGIQHQDYAKSVIVFRYQLVMVQGQRPVAREPGGGLAVAGPLQLFGWGRLVMYLPPPPQLEESWSAKKWQLLNADTFPQLTSRNASQK